MTYQQKRDLFFDVIEWGFRLLGLLGLVQIALHLGLI